MGNALRFLYRNCCEPTTQETNQYQYGVPPPSAYQYQYGVPPPTAAAASGGVSALAHDLNHFQNTSQVPEGLSQLVVSSKKAQANWYAKLLQTWKEAKPAPKTPEQASRLVIQTLKHHQKADVEGLLKYYGLPLPHNLVEVPAVVNNPTSRPHGVKFELHTLPRWDPREAPNVPKAVHVAASQRAKARAVRDYPRQMHFIRPSLMLVTENRGIDCPESKMPFGQEAKQELTKLVQGKCLLIHAYEEDRYGRIVGDIYCNGKFVQEVMLKKGCAWHYAAYDKRPELAKWEKEARAARVGLWAATNPQEPWEWRKTNVAETKLCSEVPPEMELWMTYHCRC
ncbi:hypothetical protein MKW92_049850 [Papaver armeniacum]|nr:hypothetical protein MKW92_049850 [Papaver armeniacum]